MTVCERYLEDWQRREPERFAGGLKRSPLTPEDLRQMEKELPYPLPEQYQDFLLSYQVPEVTVYVTLCGDLSCSLWQTFSLEKHGYVRSTSYEEDVVVDVQWLGALGDCGADSLRHLRKWEISPGWSQAGLFQIGQFYMGDYLLFYDLRSGQVLFCHEEDINESGILAEGWDDAQAVRAFIEEEGRPFCPDFYTFLRLMCTGGPYDETDHVFPEGVPNL